MDACTRPPHRLHLAPRAAAGIRAALRTAHGAEPCGYLIGHPEADGWWITAAPPGRNAHPSPLGGFRLEPGEQLAVRREARAGGSRVVGTWHGHLFGPPSLSRADEVALATGNPGVMLVAGRAQAGDVELCMYVACAGGAQAVAFA